MTDTHTALDEIARLRGEVARLQSIIAAMADRPVRSAPARNTDPATSHAAGPRTPDVRRFSTRSRRAQLLRVFASRPCTAQQAARIVVGDIAVSALEGCRRRVSDLLAAGYVIDTGRRDRNPGSPDECAVYAVTPAGIEALDRLGATGWSR